MHLSANKFIFTRSFVIYILLVYSLCACASSADIFEQSGVPTLQPMETGPANSATGIITPPTQKLTAVTPLTLTSENSPETKLEPEPASGSSLEPTLAPTSLPPDYWMTLPVIPAVSKNAQEIFKHGSELGRNPHTFSKIGDCQSITTYFLMYFDLPGFYNLGNYSSLQETIDWYSGSFSRQSLSVKGGFNAAAILSPLRADPKVCNSNENPIACELRINNPSIAIISLEEWWSGHPENYERYMRQIIEYSIKNGIVPILATKADNLEGNHLINQTIARLSLEFDIPLWNFWLAVQPLPDHGLMAVNSAGQPDMFHLTHSENYYHYDNPSAMISGWAMRNLTALQALDAVRHGLIENP